jgi:hypothetical protein
LGDLGEGLAVPSSFFAARGLRGSGGIRGHSYHLASQPGALPSAGLAENWQGTKPFGSYDIHWVTVRPWVPLKLDSMCDKFWVAPGDPVRELSIFAVSWMNKVARFGIKRRWRCIFANV